MKNKIFELFKDFEIFLVGGSVRDQLLNLETNDLDFATSATPDQSKAILEAAGYHPHTVGWAFGTVGIVNDQYEVHITTYRKAEDYQRDNRNPTVEWGKTIQEDLIRRDFTINALAQNSTGEIIDLFNGVQHLKDKLLVTPIDANIAFNDDPLRMLRAVRFKARLGFEYSTNVQEALYRQAHRLLILPKERIQEELNKILMTDNAADALHDLYQFRLLDYIIPELKMLSKIEQDSIYHSKNALLHTIEVLRNTSKDIILRYAAIFHDLGKMVTRSVENGNVHFYHHENISALMTYPILQRLGLPKRWCKDITYLVRNHMRANTYEKDWSDSAVRRFIRDTGEYCDRLLVLSRADITSHNPITVQKHLDSLNDFERRINELRNFKELKCPISGLVIMEFFDLPACKKVGEIKELILNAIINGELKIEDSEEVILEYAKRKMEIK